VALIPIVFAAGILQFFCNMKLTLANAVYAGKKEAATVFSAGIQKRYIVIGAGSSVSGPYQTQFYRAGPGLMRIFV
jgi:hypothetical protein